MSMVGLCAYCQRLATTTCAMCGRPACDVHLAPRTDVCVACARGSRIDEGSGSAGLP